MPVPGTDGKMDVIGGRGVILSGAKRSRRFPWRYRKVMRADSSTSLGMTWLKLFNPANL
jgi:hypothetical protein